MTQPELMKLFKMIDIDYPANKLGQDNELRDMTVARWLQKLGQYDAVRVYAAYEAHVKRSPTFAPNWQHLVAIIDDYTDTDQPAELAWGTIAKAARKFGYTDPKGAEQFLGPDLWAFISNLGWLYYCRVPVDQEATYYAQFRNAYESDRRRSTERSRLSPAVVKALEGGRLAIGGGE